MGRSIDDWVKLAAKAPEEERAACLASAEALAGSAWEWRRLVDQAERRGVGDASWRQRVTDRLLGAAIAEKDAWAFRTVADARAEAGDLVGAREALEAGVVSLDVDGRAFDWTNLAEGFAETLGDLDGARMCIDLSRSPALDARCEIAQARAERLGERDEAVAILSALTPSDGHEAWTLANVWKRLGDRARASDVLAATLARANQLREVLTLARAWASHEDAAGRDRALEVAEGSARTAADWLDIADVTHDLELHDRLRAALIRAEGVLSEATRARAAAAWLWLGETDRAEALGPRGHRPDASAPIVRDLPGFEPSATALFDDLRARITDKSLRDVAGADYGSSYDTHLFALRDLVRTGLVPRPLPWEPGEVVRLRRWSDGDDVDHVQRALCCALLCLNRDRGLDDGHNDPPILVESAVALGEPQATEAEQLLAWMYATADEDHDPDRFAALWALALLCAARDPNDPRLEGLATLAEAEVGAGASAAGILRYCVRKDLWTGLSARWFAPTGPTARWRGIVGG